MTNKQIFKNFIDTFWNFPISDYRPLVPLYYDDLKNKEGIVVHLKNGDTIVYFPKQGA